MMRTLINKTKTNAKRKTVFLTLTILCVAPILCFTTCVTLNLSSFNGERKIKITQSTHYSLKEGKFKNIYIAEHKFQGSTVGVLKKYFFGNQNGAPENFLDVIPLSRNSITGGMNNELKITWLGHSSTIIELDGKILLIDPMFSKRSSPVSFIGPKRYHKSLSLKHEDFPEIDIVIISHDHYDHLDYNTINKIHNRVNRFIVPLAVGVYLEKWGVDPRKITELDWMESIEIKGVKLVATPAQHYSGRGLFSNNKTLWSSWVIMGKNHRVFYSGDSGYNNEFKKIGKQFGPFDVTLMECGQYHQGLQKIHMLPEQALQAHLDVKGKVMIPVHWGAYNLSIHDWYDPVERAVKGALRHKIIVATPRIGETYTYGTKIPVARWWEKYKSNKGEKVYTVLK